MTPSPRPLLFLAPLLLAACGSSGGVALSPTAASGVAQTPASTSTATGAANSTGGGGATSPSPGTTAPGTTTSPTAPTAPTAKDYRQLASDAYVYGYARLQNYQKVSNRSFNNSATNPTYTGTNKFFNFPLLFTPQTAAQAGVPTPNHDTLYSAALLDLRAEPVVVTAGAVSDATRYYSVQLMDLDTDVLPYISSATNQNKGGTYLVLGPHNDSRTDATGFTGVIHSATDLVTVLGRVQVFNDADQAQAATIQRNLTIQTLSASRGTTGPAAGAAFPVYATTWASDETFFDFLQLTLPVAPVTDAGLAQRLGDLGLGVGRPFASGALGADVRQALRDGIADGQARINAAGLSGTSNVNGWSVVDQSVLSDTGSFGTNYLGRAAVALELLYMNTRVEAYYALAMVDGTGAALDGSRNYRLHFAPGQLPPSKYFWSVTAYDSATRVFFSQIPPRYNLNTTSPGLTQDADGGLTIALQAQPPTDATLLANWLPVEQKPMYVVIRSYGPEATILDGTWRPPALTVAP